MLPCHIAFNGFILLMLRKYYHSPYPIEDLIAICGFHILVSGKLFQLEQKLKNSKIRHVLFLKENKSDVAEVFILILVSLFCLTR